MSNEKRKSTNKKVLKEGEYERKNGSYEYRWRDKLGKRHSIYAKSLTELREKELDVLRDVLDGIRVDKSNLTLNDLFYKWVELKRGLKENTFQNYKYMYTQFVEADFGRMKIVDLKRSDIRSFYNRLVDNHNLKTSTIDNIHSVVHQILDLAVEDDYLRYNPSDNALKELKKAKNVDIEKKRALTVQEQTLFESYLLKSNKYSRWYPIFIVLLWTGMRVGEITGLRWCDIDFESETINVNHTLVYFSKGQTEGCTYAINTPKSKAGTRTIPMVPKVKEALLIEAQFQKEYDLKCKSVIEGYTDFIFLNRFGEVQHFGTLNKALRRITRDCNFEMLDNSKDDNTVLLPKISCHTFRHTFTTRCVEKNINLKALQSILGHADAKITLDIYTTASKDFNHSEMGKLSDYF